MSGFWDAVVVEPVLAWLAFVSAVAAVVSAWIAVVRAGHAMRSEADARSASEQATAARDEALALHRKVAEAQEDIAAMTRRLAPGSWGEVEIQAAGMLSVRNTSGDTAIVSAIELVQGRMRLSPGQLPVAIKHGDSFSFVGRYLAGAPIVELVWGTPGSDEWQQTRRHVPVR